ncbi:MAG: transporter substrate-binding domain-containing protein [Clostridiales bacterium]|nr:transporter substrate-binding domain-containing protein [Clostridiales bacterium]
MKSWKRIASVLLSSLLVLALFAGCSSSGGDTDEDNAGTSSAGGAVTTLKLGFDANFPPMGFREDGEYVGFDIDGANAAMAYIDGYDELELVPIEWATKDVELASGTIDLIWNGFTMHVDTRDDDYLWTDGYMDNNQRVVVAADSDIASLDDLEGKVIAAQANSSGMNALEESDLAGKAEKVMTIDNYDNALMQLEAGAVDAVVIDEIVINYKIAQGNAQVKILDGTLATEEYGVAFALDNQELRDQVQAALETLAENGTLEEISV